MSQENDAHRALAKFRNGDGLTDRELDVMLDFFGGVKVLKNIDTDITFAEILKGGSNGIQ